MPEIERLTITMPLELAAVVKQAVETGDYASTSEVVRAALRDWKVKRALQMEELAALKADINKGLSDVAAGRFESFDTEKIIERGKKLISRPLFLRLSDTAEADLAEIWSYIAAEASELTATRVVAKIRSACEPLLHFPLAAPAREQLAPGLRVTFSGAYAVYSYTTPTNS